MAELEIRSGKSFMCECGHPEISHELREVRVSETDIRGTVREAARYRKLHRGECRCDYNQCYCVRFVPQLEFVIVITHG